MNLPGKTKFSQVEAFLFLALFIFSFLATFFLVTYLAVQPAAGVENNDKTAVETEGIAKEVTTETGNPVLIKDFFSDHDICDATIFFQEPLKNVSLRFTLSSGKEVLKSENMSIGQVEEGQEITKVFFWELPQDSQKKQDSYTARLVVENGNQTLETRKLSFSYMSAILSNLKVLDFSADSEKASVLIGLKNQASLGYVQMPEPGIVDLNLKLLSEGGEGGEGEGGEGGKGREIVYSENLENIPVTESYYKAMFWPFLLEKGRKYTAILKVHSHSSDITSAYVSEFEAKEKVEILSADVDEYGASVTITGNSQVPFDGAVKVVLTPKDGEAQVFEEKTDILTSGKEDTVGIIWEGIPQDDYNVKIYAVDTEGEILDSYETVLRVFEPVYEVTPSEKSPAFGFPAVLGSLLCICLLRHFLPAYNQNNKNNKNNQNNQNIVADNLKRDSND